MVSKSGEKKTSAAILAVLKDVFFVDVDG